MHLFRYYLLMLLLLSLGTNLGDKVRNLHRALDAIAAQIGTMEAVSHFYASEPWGFQSDHNFVNAVAMVSTCLSLRDVLTCTQQIERDMGRVQKSTTGYSDRIIDIDILTYGNRVIAEPNLHVPHMQMHRRNFVLVPLCEIMPEWRHPQLHCTALELLQQSPDTSQLTRLADDA